MKGSKYMKRARILDKHHNHLIHTTDNVTSLFLADSQGKYFKDHLEEHHILTLFISGDKIEDIFQCMGAFCYLSSLLLYKLEVITAQRMMKLQSWKKCSICLSKSAMLIPIYIYINSLFALVCTVLMFTYICTLWV